MLVAPQSDGTWWNRPAGGREVLALSFPLIISTAFWAVSWFFDRLFLTWYDSGAMAASMPAGMMHWALLCLPSGIASYVNTFVAQYHGAGQQKRIGHVVGQGIWFGIATIPVFALTIPLAHYLFAGASSDPRQVQLQTHYFQSLALGAPAMVMANAMSALYTGRGQTGLVMIVNVAGSLLDVVLDYCMVFGEFGFPEWGIVGAGISTALGNWFNVLVFGLLMLRPYDREHFGIAEAWRLDWPLMGRLMKYGFPSGLPMLIETFGFAMLTRFIAGLGEVEGAATSLAFNVNSVAFVPIIGLGIGVATLVGQYLGDNNDRLAARATWTGLTFALGFSVVFAAAYWFVPDWFIYFHAQGADPAEFTRVRELTITLLRFVAIYCLFDATQIIFVSALKGAGDTRFVLYVAIVLSTLMIVLGKIAEHYYHWGIFGWWYVMTGWIFAMAFVYLVRFLQGSWRTMRVIEPEFVAKEVASS
ncbi:Multidrug resistance protein MdtK [Anatilimnocola aggregata]|uniref:Multidrug-efflux transporter n=1 Tax=Anatilimnocola aggregata TaxID=2528021 RepID=A0A517Y600_9BACT|nr:MATE family efflux transporter [Anatilimnocola aggregata]QDU25661.1 Multidrug resistance protein MdtK [Anatilimnocola aggregata]